MKFVCDAPGGKTWFRIETDHEAETESTLMNHAVARYFIRAKTAAHMTYQPPAGAGIERDIGLKDHIARAMPLFLTLRDDAGAPLATAMAPNPAGESDPDWRAIIVGPGNSDPYVAHADAIEALGAHLGVRLDRDRCYPYTRG